MRVERAVAICACAVVGSFGVGACGESSPLDDLRAEAEEVRELAEAGRITEAGQAVGSLRTHAERLEAEGKIDSAKADEIIAAADEVTKQLYVDAVSPDPTTTTTTVDEDDDEKEDDEGDGRGRGKGHKDD